MYHRVHFASGLINPFFLHMNDHEAVALSENSVKSGDEVFIVDKHETIRLEPGEKAFVFLFAQNMYMETAKECEVRLQEEENERERARVRAMEQHLAYLQFLNTERDRAYKTNEKYACLPFDWVTGRKTVLSGLSENSMGNGVNSATVYHIMLLEPYKDGRLERGKYDFLCTKDQGKRWADPQAVAYDGDSNPYNPAVTCPACENCAKAILKRTGFGFVLEGGHKNGI